MRPPAPLPLLALALLSAGCASTAPGLRVVRALERPVDARAVAVYPFGFRWSEPPSRSLLLGMAAVDALVDTQRVLVFGPSEFTVLRHEADDPRVGTDLLAAMALRSLPTTGFVALRAWAEQRVERTSGAVDGRGVVRRTEQVTYVEHLELLDGGGGGVLLALRGEAVRDPAAAADPFDPTPELTRLHRQLVAAAWAALAPRLSAPALQPLALQVRWLPAAALDWAPPGARSAAAMLAKGDPLDLDLQRLAIYRFVDPTSADEQLVRELRLPGGLLVERAEGPWGAALRPGDVIVTANGEPATGAQVVQRAAALSRSGVVELVVRRGGATVPVSVVVR